MAMNEDDLEREALLRKLEQPTMVPGGEGRPPIPTLDHPGALSTRTRDTTFADGTRSGFQTSVGEPLGLDDPFFASESDGAGGSRFKYAGNTERGMSMNPDGSPRAGGGTVGGGIQASVDPSTFGLDPEGKGARTTEFRDENRDGIDDRDAPSSQTPDASTPAAPAQSYRDKMRGFDMGKMDDPAKQTEKYKIGRIMEKYDPRGGVTPEMLAELNALGIAEFSGQGDKLTVNNTKNDPRFGKGGTADVVYGLKGNNADTAWQPWFIDEGAAAMPAGAGGGGGGAGLPMGGGASSFEGIQSLAPTDTAFYKKLQDQIGQILGGPGAFDREALLKMLGG